MGYQKFKELENCDVEMYLNNSKFSLIFVNFKLGFNLSNRKKIETPVTLFRINELVINKGIKNLKL